ncbi:MAG: sulfonate/nitrate transporter [Rhodovulum sulfidophilum]|uniref:Sulfonate/nitrate transporter n=1 Tax=Rhodovulum sulfidophilum TaxID=35806 RepID=A0A2W5NBI1_RHOSU|nr:MAG: sulfonate/nitrate transporter [Rhodovulum sulfidophilum]
MTSRPLRASAFGLAFALLASTASANEPVTFMIDWLPAGDKAAAYLGVQSGIFAEAGLDVTIQSGRGSSDVVTKLATGAADIGTGGLAALLQAKAEGEVPVTAIASIYTLQPDAIFTTEGAGIASLGDLVGKKVATATFSSSNVIWPVLLEANGIDPDAIQLIKADPGALAPMLATGQVDATINWLTVAPVFEGPLGEAGKTLVTLPWSEMGDEGYGLSLFASDRMIAEKPEVAKSFVAAYEKAQDAAIADPKAAGEALAAMVPEVSAADAETQFAVSIPLIINAISEKDGKGVFEPGLLATTWDWVARAQGLPADAIDPAKAVDGQFLP